MKANNINYDWQEKSLCKTELKFVPETGEYVHYTVNDFYVPLGKLVSPEVQKMCKRCPVQKQCLEHALHHEDHGCWAGTSEKQRIKMRRKRGISKHAPQSFA